jgi:sortase B
MAMNKKLRLTLILVLLAVFFYSAFQLLVIWLDYQENEKFYEATRTEYANIVVPPAEEEPPEVELPPYDEAHWYMDVDIDFERLKSVNSEVVGWLMVPDSKISYPLVKGRDNQKYLTRASDNTYSKLGSIFLDYRNKGDFTDRHTIIYGHNTKNGAMFGALHEFRKQEYLDSHPQFFIFTEEGTLIYEIFSAYVTDAYSDTYRLDLGRDSAYASYLKKMAGQSQSTTGIEVGIGDRVVTLSTCTSSGLKTERFVIQGRLIEQTSTTNEQ